jgi:nucleotide-binding universal stress UspA family protein
MEIKIRRILCPVDFSPSSDHALQYAVAFARAHGAELELLHIVELPNYSTPDFPLPPAALDGIVALARKRLETVTEETRKLHAPVRSHLDTGFVFTKIIECARDREVDLIVMGTHGRTALAHMLMGSVAEKVVRKSPCPVLTVKHPEHKFSMP